MSSNLWDFIISTLFFSLVLDDTPSTSFPLWSSMWWQWVWFCWSCCWWLSKEMMVVGVAPANSRPSGVCGCMSWSSVHVATCNVTVSGLTSTPPLPVHVPLGSFTCAPYLISMWYVCASARVFHVCTCALPVHIHVSVHSHVHASVRSCCHFAANDGTNLKPLMQSWLVPEQTCCYCIDMNKILM